MTSQVSKCELLGSFGYVVQLILGFLSFSVLIGKRQLEQPKRLWKIFLMDSSKQMSSAVIGHIQNVLLAQILSNDETSDPCNWYFITYFFDCTFGVFLCYLLMKGFEFLFEITGQITGNYYRIDGSGLNASNLEIKEFDQNVKKVTIDYKIYFFQVILWNFVVLISKSLLFIIEKSFAKEMQDSANWLFQSLNDSPQFKLIVVMALIPLVMNSICFWVQDSILKKNGFRANEKELVMDLLYERSDTLTEVDSSVELTRKKKQASSKKGRLHLSEQEEI